jgi:hypothetical protein
MNKYQKIAYHDPCFLAEECQRPQFRHGFRLPGPTIMSAILTLNIGLE